MEDAFSVPFILSLPDLMQDTLSCDILTLLWSHKDRWLKVLQDSNGGHSGQITSAKVSDDRAHFS